MKQSHLDVLNGIYISEHSIVTLSEAELEVVKHICNSNGIKNIYSIHKHENGQVVYQISKDADIAILPSNVEHVAYLLGALEEIKSRYGNEEVSVRVIGDASDPEVQVSGVSCGCIDLGDNIPLWELQVGGISGLYGKISDIQAALCESKFTYKNDEWVTSELSALEKVCDAGEFNRFKVLQAPTPQNELRIAIEEHPHPMDRVTDYAEASNKFMEHFQGFKLPFIDVSYGPGRDKDEAYLSGCVSTSPLFAGDSFMMIYGLRDSGVGNAPLLRALVQGITLHENYEYSGEAWELHNLAKEYKILHAEGDPQNAKQDYFGYTHRLHTERLKALCSITTVADDKQSLIINKDALRHAMQDISRKEQSAEKCLLGQYCPEPMGTEFLAKVALEKIANQQEVTPEAHSVVNDYLKSLGTQKDSTAVDYINAILKNSKAQEQGIDIV